MFEWLFENLAWFVFGVLGVGTLLLVGHWLRWWTVPQKRR